MKEIVMKLTSVVLTALLVTAVQAQQARRSGPAAVNPAPAGGAAAVKPKDKQTPAPKPAAPSQTQRLTLPKDAVKIEAFTYRWTDGDGKVWIYRETPFGLVRYEETASARAAAEADAQPALVAFDEGERVRFERQTPFGKQRWYRNKSELSGEEAEAFERLEQSGKQDQRSSGEKKPDTE
jgi:hypothetical protein